MLFLLLNKSKLLVCQCLFSEYIEALAFHKFLISGEVLLYSEVIGALQFVDAESEGDKKLILLIFELPIRPANFWLLD